VTFPQMLRRNGASARSAHTHSHPVPNLHHAACLHAGNGDASLAAALYQGMFEGTSISFTLLFWRAISREHRQVALTPLQGRQAMIRFGIANRVLPRRSTASGRVRLTRAGARPLCWPHEVPNSGIPP
jgi:hypothetical protein